MLHNILVAGFHLAINWSYGRVRTCIRISKRPWCGPHQLMISWLLPGSRTAPGLQLAGSGKSPVQSLEPADNHLVLSWIGTIWRLQLATVMGQKLLPQLLSSLAPDAPPGNRCVGQFQLATAVPAWASAPLKRSHGTLGEHCFVRYLNYNCFVINGLLV